MMSRIERALYASKIQYVLNQVLLPLKLVIPQPLIAKIPFLATNYDIRIGVSLQVVQGRLLDVGCGTNRLVRAYRARGGEGTGVDVYAWDGVDLLVEDTSKLPFSDASFDTISFIACLNHIPNRLEVLKEARRLLTPNGRIVLTNLTPGLSRIWHAWAFWDRDQYERGMAEGELFGFAHDELISMLRGIEFVLETRHHFSWGLNTLYIFRKTCSAGARAASYG
jgi:SAM-dependent methyltransferase